MLSFEYVYWQEGAFWLGYSKDYPDYWTQGESLDDLKEHLTDLYRDVADGQIPGIRTGRQPRVNDLRGAK